MMKRIPHPDKMLSTIQDPAVYYERLKKRARSQFKPFLKQIHKLGTKGDYLEIGSGPGILASSLAASLPDIRITAVELSSDMIDLGKKQIKKTGMENRIKFIQGNVEEESFMSSLGKFDLVYSTFALHHWKNPEQALRLMTQVVKEKRTLLIFDFKRVWWLYVHPKHNGFLDSIRASYLPKEMKQMFRKIGIEKVKIKTPFPYFWQFISIQK